jgi:hypothetical protein
MAKKNSLRLDFRKIAAGDASDVIYYPEEKVVDAGERHHLTLLSFEDETSTPIEVQISAGRAGKMKRITEQISPLAGRTYSWSDEIVLTEGERLEIYFSGATAGDVLLAWLQGYWVEVI